MTLTAFAPITTLLAACAVAAALSFVVASLLSRHADWLGLQDLPNARSSHHRPTPRGGGIAVAAAFLLVVPWPLPAGSLSHWPVWLPLVAAAMLALVGLVDDLRGLGYGVRLLAQSIAVAALLAVLVQSLATTGASQPFDGASDVLLSWRVAGIAIILIPLLLSAGVWWINLFNFMDGIDGLAATQALFMLLATVAVKTTFPGLEAQPLEILTSPAGAMSLVLAAAVTGFLFLNWAPARVFLGDAGSLFLGFSISAIATHDVVSGDISPWTWLILGASFSVDATTTLLRRWITGQRVTAAHSSHLYQRLARRWGKHWAVALVYCLVNVTWLLPLAVLAHRAPSWAPVVLGVACVPLIAIAWRGGAGLQEG